MILSIEGGVKIYRRNLEETLEKLSQAESSAETAKKTEEVKKLLALPDEELVDVIRAKNKDIDKEISEDQLESVSGGLVIDAGYTLWDYVIVDDVTGEILDSDCFIYDSEWMREICEHAGVSMDKISVEDYNKKFGKNFKFGSNEKVYYWDTHKR
ncbi:MAG: hypothetical protein IJ740_09970 [Ruminococcus sp.]|nr:hypothetical protein [Ruminococcus sp.]